MAIEWVYERQIQENALMAAVSLTITRIQRQTERRSETEAKEAWLREASEGYTAHESPSCSDCPRQDRI